MSKFNFVCLFIFISLQVFSPTLVDALVVGGTCSFEHDRCNFFDPNGNTWMLATNATKIDPGYDHTCSLPTAHDTCGQWLSTRPPTSFSGTQSFALINNDAIAIKAGQHYCLKFYYHFMGLEDASFEVDVNTKKSIFNAQKIWTKVTPQGNSWKLGYAEIISQTTGSVYVMFQARLQSQYQDVVGLDDISILPSACPRTPDCDFETDLCGWEKQGFKLASGSHPTTDHTSEAKYGHYLLLSGNNQKATLTGSMSKIAQIGRSQYSCLKGWYKFMYDSSSNQKDGTSYLEVNVTNSEYRNFRTTIQSIYNDNLNQKWLMFSMNIHSSNLNHTNVIITAYTHGGTQIALDDFLLTMDGCRREYEGDCNFETDFCGWMNFNSIQWIRNNGRGLTMFRGVPPYDTTTHTRDGWYALLPTKFLGSSYLAELRSLPMSRTLACVRFNYYASSGSSTQYAVLNVYVVELSKNKIVARGQVNSTLYPEWTKFQLNVPGILNKYSIRIETTSKAHLLKTSLAIDDIELSDNYCSNNPHPKPPSTTPLPPSEKVWDCNFDTCRGWTFDDNWLATSFRSLKDKSKAPRIDHTKKSPHYKYLLWRPKVAPGTNVNTTVSVVKMRLNMTTSTQHCLSFWYYDSADIPFELDVFYVNGVHKFGFYSLVRSGVAQHWKLVNMPIMPMIVPGFVQIEMKTGINSKGAFALDDIMMRPGKCDHLEGFTFTFEDYFDAGFEVARLQPLGNTAGRVLVPKDRKNYPMAPAKDFTTGKGNYFLFANTKADVNTTYEIQLILTNLPPTDTRESRKQCVRFAYQIVGANTTLITYAKYSSSASADFDRALFRGKIQHNTWQVAEFEYEASYMTDIYFVMTKTFDTTSYVALDDISIRNRRCNTRMECDFDDDMCSFYFKERVTDTYELSRMISPPRDPSFPGPKFDHTLGSYGGGYLFMKTNADGKRTTAVYSPIHYDPRTYTRCLSLWTQITGADAVVKVTMFAYSKTKPVQSFDVLVIGNVTENSWTRHLATIPLTEFEYETEFKITVTTSKAKTLVAIDDISMDYDTCDYNNKVSCKNRQTINVSQVDNFVEDCTDGSDELYHDCDFEKSSSCGWYNNDLSHEDGFWRSNPARWSLVSSSMAPKGFPRVDGSGRASGHYLALVTNKVNQSYAKRTLTRKPGYLLSFKHAFHTCKLTFDYVSYNPGKPHVFGAIEVLVGNQLGNELVRQIFHNNANSSWQKAEVHIGSYTEAFWVALDGVRIAPYIQLAIDNIKFVGCGQPPEVSGSCAAGQILCATTKICIAKEDLCDFQNDCGDNWDEGYGECSKDIYDTNKVVPNCDFELSQDYCGFANDTPSGRNYFRDEQGSRYSLTMPSSDHTTRDVEGQYATLQVADRKQPNQMARLYTPMMTSKGGDCVMHFFYNNIYLLSVSNKGRTPPSLRVYVRYADGGKGTSKTLFTETTPTYDWIKGGVKFSSSDPFQFVFEGKVSNSAMSISLDDVSFSQQCMSSNDTYKPKGKKKSTALTIVLVLLAVAIVAAVGFFLYRKKQEGGLSTFSFRKSDTTNAGLVNDNYGGN